MITFRAKGNDLFLYELRKEVAQFLDQKGSRGNATLFSIFKAIFLFSLRLLVYCSILFGIFPFGMWGINYALLGVIEILIAFNVGHDALHGAFSHSEKINRLLGMLSFDWIGLNSTVWKKSHNGGHHIFTNIYQADPDISKPYVLRLSPHDPKLWFHRVQHFYAWFLYSLVGINWVFWSDWSYFAKTYKSWTRGEIFSLFFWKIFTLTYFIGVPALVAPLTLGQAAVGYLISQLVGGFTVSVVFQLAHVVEGVEFPLPNSEGKIEASWGEHEMRTTANFAASSFWVTELVGGLNHQVEHHLFPHVSHGHYPEISKIVRAGALRKGFPYHEKKSMRQAVLSHARFLRDLGR